MAAGAFAVTSGRIAACLVFAVILLPLCAVAWRAGGLQGLGAGDWATIRFTLAQAVVSAVLSVALAVPLARALARRQFGGRGLLITLLGAPFILPVIVAILGLIAVFGQAGLLGALLGALGFDAPPIFGFHGVVLAHVFFNLPLAVRLLLQGWLAIPGERFRLAGALGFGPSDIWRHLEWPMLREVVPGLFVVVFLICTTSFAVALTLGGGPRATTIELAIYQAFRFDFDPGRAATLSLVQVALTGTAAFLAARLSLPSGLGGGLDRPVSRWDAAHLRLRVLDAAVIGAAALFLLLPLAAIAARGALALGDLPSEVWAAAARSVVVALASAGLTTVLALTLAQAVARGAGTLVEMAGTAAIALSPLVLGTGAYILLLPIADPVALALPVTAVVNALMSLPFAFRALLPAARSAEQDYGRLADSLGVTGWWRLRRLTLPRLKRPLGFAAGLAAALSMGDLGVIALFADPDFATLPLQVYRLMAAYRMDEAGAAALLLLGLTLALFWLFDRGARANAPV